MRKTDAKKQFREARIASQRVESGIHPDRGHSIRTVVIGPVEPGKGLFFISQGRIQASHVESADITLARLAFDAREHCASLILPTSECIGCRYLGENHRTLRGFHGAICGVQCLFGLAKFRIGEGQTRSS